MLGERFVRYRLEFARGLRSVYSTNLLRLLMTQKDTGFKTITLADFRATMEVRDTYRYADIKRYAITPAFTSPKSAAPPPPAATARPATPRE